MLPSGPLRAGHPLRRVATWVAARFGIHAGTDIEPHGISDELEFVKQTDDGRLVFFHDELGVFFYADGPDTTIQVDGEALSELANPIRTDQTGTNGGEK